MLGKNYYICSMENVNMIIDILTKNNFIKNAEEEIWELGEWKVRFFMNLVEFYEDKLGGRYLLGDIDKIDAQAVIDSSLED